MQIEKIKICYIVSSLANEGPVNVLYNIIRFIDLTTFKVTIITLIPEKEHSRINDFLKLDIEVIQLSKENQTKGIIRKLIYFRKLIKKINPNVIHSHCPRSLFFISLLSKKFKKIYTAHIFPGIQQIALYGSFKGRIIIKLCNFLMMRMDLPIACSDSVSKEFKNIHGWDIKSINNGCSMDVWSENYESKQRIRKKLGLKDGVKYFIFIGRFSKEKKPDFIIDAFKNLNNSMLGLVMLGDGPMFEELKIMESDTINLVGFKTNVYDYLIACDFYISASETEGLANTLLESMSVGIPMLLSNIPSHNQIINGTSNTIGILFNNFEYIDLINSINKIIKWSDPNITSNIKEYYKANFTAQKMSKEYQDEYISLLKN